jgi:hypothetical protein
MKIRSSIHPLSVAKQTSCWDCLTSASDPFRKSAQIEGVDYGQGLLNHRDTYSCFESDAVIDCVRQTNRFVL